MDVKDGAEAALMEALKETQVMPIGNPRLGTVQEGTRYNGSVYTNLRAFLQMLVVPDSFLWPNECTVCLCQSVINLFIDLGIQGNDTPQVAELMNCLQL